MTTMNLVVVAGRLTRDPTVRQTANGTAVADLGVAINERYKSSAGEEVSRTCCVDATVWGRPAEACGKFLRKGAGVLVDGKLSLDRCEGRNGEKHSRLKVVADRVQFLDRPVGEDGESGVAPTLSGRRRIAPAERNARRRSAAGDLAAARGTQ